MPARSNDFQAVAYFIRSYVDADAAVTESAILAWLLHQALLAIRR